MSDYCSRELYSTQERRARKRGQNPVLVDLDTVDVGVDLRQDLLALDATFARAWLHRALSAA